MNRTRRNARPILLAGAAGLLASTVLASGCGKSHTAAEQAYLDELQAKGSEITLSDPEGKLEAGHGLCDSLAKVKPEDRTFYVSGFKNSPQLGYTLTGAALSKLCPDLVPSYLY